MNWKEFKDRAHVPYSGNKQVALTVGSSGKAYAGVRVENVSFPLSIDAVQASLFCCISEGDEAELLILPEDTEDEPLLDFWLTEFEIEMEQRADISDLDSGITVLEPVHNIRLMHQQLEQHSRVIHSDFPVSALLQVEDGLISGVNVEVSSWALGLCAERVALAKAIALGYHKFGGMSLHSRHGDYSTPCGACRQVMAELLPYHPIQLLHNDGTRSELLSVDLLPYHFKSEYLTDRNS
jgi:homotetrameric cytidine deaminase